MLSRDFPTDVPPYFWMTHGTLSELEFRSRSSEYDVGVELRLSACDMVGQ
jgi:hypothetical protein